MKTSNRWLFFQLLSLLLFCLCSQSLFALDAKEDSGIKRMGLFVAADNGGPERVRLKYSYSDAFRISKALNELGGLADEDYRILHNPDRAKLITDLEYYKQKIAKLRSHNIRTEFFFYYSGHSDVEGLLLDQEILLYHDLKKYIDNINSEMTILILDSCSSGIITRLK